MDAIDVCVHTRELYQASLHTYLITFLERLQCGAYVVAPMKGKGVWCDIDLRLPFICIQFVNEAESQFTVLVSLFHKTKQSAIDHSKTAIGKTGNSCISIRQ